MIATTVIPQVMKLLSTDPMVRARCTTRALASGESSVSGLVFASTPLVTLTTTRLTE